MLDMDFHLNSLLNLSQATVFTCYCETDFICLHLQLNNTSITCPYFLNRTTSGITEGINTKIKLILRQSYGFADFKSMREKLLACLFK